MWSHDRLVIRGGRGKCLYLLNRDVEANPDNVAATGG
jgi:hypothetical protein